MTFAKAGAFATAAITLVYIGILGQHGWLLIISGDALQIIFGALILVMPAFALFSIFREFRFGVQVEKLGKRLEAENAWPVFNFELRPSGRPTRTSAQSEFDVWRKKTESDPSQWRNWFALGLAYDAASDRKRARSAMREAIRLASFE